MPHQGASAETLPPWGANDQIPTAVPGTQVFTQCMREGVRSQVPGTHPESPAPHFPAEHQSRAELQLLVQCPQCPSDPTPACVLPCPRRWGSARSCVLEKPRVHKYEFKSVPKNRGFSERGVCTASATQGCANTLDSHRGMSVLMQTKKNIRIPNYHGH